MEAGSDSDLLRLASASYTDMMLSHTLLLGLACCILSLCTEVPRAMSSNEPPGPAKRADPAVCRLHPLITAH
eukprot:5814613-Pyramimonas_sp.AAC.1